MTSPLTLPAARRLPLALLIPACAAGAAAIAGTAWASALGLSTLALALLGGLLLTQTLPARWREAGAPALSWFKGPVLKTAIVLYGLRIPLTAVADLGPHIVALNAGQVIVSLLLAAWLGRRLGMTRPAALLIGAGNGICGAAAVLAAEPVLRGRDRDTAMAVAAVVIFGTLNMLLLPVLFHQWPTLLGAPGQYAVLAGTTVQEVAQVLVAAQAMSPDLADHALLVKMVRVMMLAPALLALAACCPTQGPAQAHSETTGSSRPRIGVPRFALLFVGALLINGLGLVPDAVAPPLAALDDALLALAMAALGLSTHAGLLRQAGWRPLALGAVLSLTTLSVAALALRAGFH